MYLIVPNCTAKIPGRVLTAGLHFQAQQPYHYCPQTANENWHALEGGIPLPWRRWVGGLGRFPLVRTASRRFGRRAVDSPHSAEMLPIGNKLCSNRVLRFDHHGTP